MSTIKELIQGLGPTERFFSYEFFPPKTKSGMQNLMARLQRMSKLGSLFVTVTWGAGGSSASKSVELATICQQELGIPTCMHLTCTNMDKSVIDDTLERAKAAGIRNILALRGDPPRDSEYYWANGGTSEFKYAVDLVRYIRKTHGDYFCIGVAAYPEGHVDAVYSSVQDPLHDLPYLVEKVEAGADFLISQLFYDSDRFLAFEKLIRDDKSGVLADIPLIPGMMPINTYQSFVRAAKLSNAHIPEELMDRINKIPIGDDEQVKQVGVEVVSDLVEAVGKGTAGRVRGFHFYTLNLEKSVALILERTGLAKVEDAEEADEEPSRAASGATVSSVSTAVDGISIEDSAIDDSADILLPPQFPSGQRRRSSLHAHNRVVLDSEATAKPGVIIDPVSAVSEREAGAKVKGAPTDALAISTGEGDLGREATWDDFPNGRFGDSRSPAFGEIDGYGPTLHVDPTQAIKLWGYPVDIADISVLFARHIRNELDVLPFSDQPLSPETSLIQEELLQMINRGLLTVASQPAGNSIKSTDRIFGWGPPGGRVFQKAFVEFFVSDEQWAKLQPKLDAIGEVVSYYEGVSSNLTEVRSSNLPPGSSNAATWGVFPNREILQSTIIEEESFVAWLEEAFIIWREWRALYKVGTASYKLLDHIYSTYHLVSLVHHDYFDESALWRIFEEF